MIVYYYVSSMGLVGGEGFESAVFGREITVSV